MRSCKIGVVGICFEGRRGGDLSDPVSETAALALAQANIPILGCEMPLRSGNSINQSLEGLSFVQSSRPSLVMG